MKNTFGSAVTVTIFGESHGPAVGAVLDGLAAGLPVDGEYIARQMDKRRAKPGGLSTPIFFLVSPKKKTAVEPSKEKTLVAAQLRARDAPCRAAGCGPKLFCSVKVMSA